MYFRNSGFFKLKHKDNNKEKHNLGGKLKKSQSGTTQNRMRFVCRISRPYKQRIRILVRFSHISD